MPNGIVLEPDAAKALPREIYGPGVIDGYARLDFHGFAGLGHDDFTAGEPGANLVGKPLDGIGLAVGEQHGARHRFTSA